MSTLPLFDNAAFEEQRDNRTAAEPWRPELIERTDGFVDVRPLYWRTAPVSSV